MAMVIRSILDWRMMKTLKFRNFNHYWVADQVCKSERSLFPVKYYL